MVCGDPYVGENAPSQCPFCGAHGKYIVEANRAVVSFDVILNDTDRENVRHALDVEVSNSTFYAKASKASQSNEIKLLFKALSKIEVEHAAIWRKILKLDQVPVGNDECFSTDNENLHESHTRETRAIDFYKKAASVSQNARVRMIFNSLIEIESDHLHTSEERI
jgi:rubrerythrin